MPLLEAAALSLGCVVGQDQFLPATQLELVPQLLIRPGLGAIFFEPRSCCQELLLNDAAAFLPLLHVIEFSAGLLDAGVEEGDACQFIDEPAAVAVAHRHDPGHVPLHHHVASLWIDPKPTQLGLELLKIAGDSVGAVTAAVGASWHHPQFAGHRPLGLIRSDPGAFRRSLDSLFRSVGLPVREIEANTHSGFSRFPGLENAAVHEIGKAIGPHPPAIGKTEAEQHPIKNVAFARSIRACHHGETGLQGDRHRPPEGLEVR